MSELRDDLSAGDRTTDLAGGLDNIRAPAGLYVRLFLDRPFDEGRGRELPDLQNAGTVT
jgi:hypothetical protein